MLHLAKAEPRVFTYKTHPQSHKHTGKSRFRATPRSPWPPKSFKNCHGASARAQSQKSRRTGRRREHHFFWRRARRLSESTTFADRAAKATSSQAQSTAPAHKIEHFWVPGEGARFIRKNTCKTKSRVSNAFLRRVVAGAFSP